MPDEAATPIPLPPTDAAPDAPTATGGGSSDGLARAFEATRRTRATDDMPDIAADDEGATSLAEEMGAGSQKP